MSRHSSGDGATRFDGVVLCGGSSSRMGADKTFVDFDGSALVERPIQALSRAARLIAVGGSAAQLETLGVEHVKDPVPNCGPALAVHSVAQHLSASGNEQATMVVLSNDLPRIDDTAVHTLVRAQQDYGADVVVPLRAGRPQWLVSAWRRAAVAETETTTSMSMRSMCRNLSILYLVDSYLDDRCLDVDTPAELRLAQSVPIAQNDVQSKQ